MAIDVFLDMNPRQREAIAHRDGPLLVVAGAGSGKTRVITHRIANLIQTGVHPTGILAITFTNKAAGEMQERVFNLLGITTPWISTFHSVGLRLLKLERNYLPFAHPFTVMDTDDQQKQVKRVMAELELDSKEIKPRDLLSQIGRWKNRLKLPDEVADDEIDDDVHLAVYRRYAELAREECLVDFDDLLLLPVRLFEEQPEVLERYREKFGHILIDEYQDTNLAQYRLIQLLGTHHNVCATGDPDQAIYGWRGADISNILNFERDFPGCTTVLLEQNYRSTAGILRAAQAVVENNRNRKDKVIFTENPSGEKVRLITVNDQTDEAMAVAAACQRLHEQGHAYRGLAIFYRTNAQSRSLEDWLIRRNLPYRIIGGTRFYDRREVKDLLAYCKLLLNPRDLISFERVANVPRRGVGARTLEAVRELAMDEDVGALEVLLQPELLERVAVGRSGKALRELAGTWRRLLALDRRDPGSCVQHILEITELETHYGSEANPDDERTAERVANVREVVSAAAQFHTGNPDDGLEGFLDHVSLLTSVDNRLAQGEDAVVMMTLHASKGLEFPVVFIVGCEQGVLPLVRGRSEPDYEEERRLMYVGITRAQERLFLSRAALRTQFGRTQRNPPSMFLAEIPDECIDHRDRTAPGLATAVGTYREGPSYPEHTRARRLVDDEEAATPDELLADGQLTTGAALKSALRTPGSSQGLGQARRSAEPSSRPEPTHAPGWEIGARIEHQTFGTGTIRELRGGDHDPRVIVDFDRAGTKELVLAYAASRMRRL